MVTITDNSHGDTTIENMKKIFQKEYCSQKGVFALERKYGLATKPPFT